MARGSIVRVAAVQPRTFSRDEEVLSPPGTEDDVMWCRPGQSHDRRPELYGDLVAPQPDAFEYHYERRGLDTWRAEYEKIRRAEEALRDR